MKFAGFQFSFGSFDVNLIESDGLDHVKENQYAAMSCAKCEFTRPRMFWCHCGHLLCDECVLSFGYPDKTHCTNAICSICNQETKAALFELSEAVLSKQLCLCLWCNRAVSLGVMKFHLITCYGRRKTGHDVQSNPLMYDYLAKESVKELFSAESLSPPQIRSAVLDSVPRVLRFGEERNVNKDSAESRTWHGEHIVALQETPGFARCYTSTTFRILGMAFWFAVDKNSVHMIALDAPDPQPLKGRVSIHGLGNDGDKTRPLSGWSSKDCLGAPKTGAFLRFGAPAHIDRIPHILRITVELE